MREEIMKKRQNSFWGIHKNISIKADVIFVTYLVNENKIDTANASVS